MTAPRSNIPAYKILLACCLFLLIAGLAVHFAVDLSATSLEATTTLLLHLPVLLAPVLALTVLVTLTFIRLLPRPHPDPWLQPPTPPPPIPTA